LAEAAQYQTHLAALVYPVRFLAHLFSMQGEVAEVIKTKAEQFHQAATVAVEMAQQVLWRLLLAQQI
jgi:hypothetical protein